MSAVPLPLPEKHAELRATARALVADAKGLLAADESTGSIKKRLEGVGKENTEDNRREWRDLLFTADGELNEYLSGVITFDETLMKHGAQLESKYKGQDFPSVLKQRGLIPGIKTDGGTVPLHLTDPAETTTQGLDKLLDRSKAYYDKGARFAKWRCTYTVSKTTPSQLAIESNAESLARYASISQEAGLVPIVEPEVLMNGDFTIQDSARAHNRAYSHLFRQLNLHKVYIEGTILKASMVLPGDKSGSKPKPEEVAQATVSMLASVVPPAIPGIVFLSGGLGDEESASFLNAINLAKQKDPQRAPWALTFSYGRALQQAAMKVWSQGDVKKAQEIFVERARTYHEAALGKLKKA